MNKRPLTPDDDNNGEDANDGRLENGENGRVVYIPKYLCLIAEEILPRAQT